MSAEDAGGDAAGSGKLKLQSQEGTVFEVSKQVSFMSQLCKNMAEGGCPFFFALSLSLSLSLSHTHFPLGVFWVIFHVEVLFPSFSCLWFRALGPLLARCACPSTSACMVLPLLFLGLFVCLFATARS